MNKTNKKKLSEQWDELDKLKDQYAGELTELKNTVTEFTVKWGDKFREVRNAVEQVKDDEQEAYDNLSEKQQSGDKGSDMQEAISELDSAYNALDGLCDKLDDFDLDDELKPETDLDDVLTNIDNAKGES